MLFKFPHSSQQHLIPPCVSPKCIAMNDQFSVEFTNEMTNNCPNQELVIQNAGTQFDYNKLDLKSIDTNSTSNIAPPPGLHSSSRSLTRVQHRKSNESTLKWPKWVDPLINCLFCLYLNSAMATGLPSSDCMFCNQLLFRRLLRPLCISCRLEQNYEFQEGICLPRCLLYQQYLHYMAQQQPTVKPIGAAAFGKLVRQKFPKITTRRLGTRGQSKYHYYGISIQPNSVYFPDQRTLFCNESGEQLGQSFPNNTTAGYFDHLEARLTTTGAADIDPDLTQWSSSYSVSQYRSSSSSTTGSQKSKRRNKMLLLKSIQAHSGSNKKSLDQPDCPTFGTTTPISSSQHLIGLDCDLSSVSSVLPTGGQCERIPTTTTLSFYPLTGSRDESTQGYFQSHFPCADDFLLPPNLPRSMLSTFLLMYRSHSQRILDTFQLANVEELQKTVTHFWCEMPAHLGSLMAHPHLAVVIECVDSLLYRTIEESLSMLSLMPDMSGAFVSDIELILSQMPAWLTGSILAEQSRMRTIVAQQLPYPGQQERHLATLVNRKLHLFGQFALAVRMQLKFFKMAKECRHRVMQPKHSSQMIHELDTLCLEQIDHKFGFHLDRSLFVGSEPTTGYSSLTFPGIEESGIKTETEHSGQDNQLEHRFHTSFDYLLQVMRMSIDFDQLLRWARSLVQSCVLECQRPCLTTRSQALLYAFNCYVLGLMRELTINAAKSLDLWNLVFVCLKEFLLIEISRCIRYERQNVRRMALMSSSGSSQHKMESTTVCCPQQEFRVPDPSHWGQEFGGQFDQQHQNSSYTNPVNRDQLDCYNTLVASPSSVQLDGPGNYGPDSGLYYGTSMAPGTGQSMFNFHPNGNNNNFDQSGPYYNNETTTEHNGPPLCHWTQGPAATPNSQQPNYTTYDTSGTPGWPGGYEYLPGNNYNGSRQQQMAPPAIECNLNGACINLISNINCYYSPAAAGGEVSDSQTHYQQQQTQHPDTNNTTGNQIVTCAPNGNVYTCLP